MINQTTIITNIMNMSSSDDIILYTSKSIFLTSIIAYWLFQFILTLVIGMLLVKKDKGNFFAIFILTQLTGAIILFFIFIIPIIPQLISKLW